jgi:hypothetical protein
MLGFLGKDLKLAHALNTPGRFAYGYADMFFLTNPGASQKGTLSLGSCNDVAVYIGTGTVSRGHGGNWSLVYHRTESPKDGGKNCPCDNHLDPTIMVPSGSFRLVTITRGSDCTGYLEVSPYKVLPDVQMDWEGFRQYTGQN